MSNTVPLKCDQRCYKAWGCQMRPRIYLGDPTRQIHTNTVPEDISIDQEDFVWLADSEFDLAPLDPGTRVEDTAKPDDFTLRGNPWCEQECERFSRTISAIGPDLTRPLPNLLSEAGKKYLSDWAVELDAWRYSLKAGDRVKCGSDVLSTHATVVEINEQLLPRSALLQADNLPRLQFISSIRQLYPPIATQLQEIN